MNDTTQRNLSPLPIVSRSSVSPNEGPDLERPGVRRRQMGLAKSQPVRRESRFAGRHGGAPTLAISPARRGVHLLGMPAMARRKGATDWKSTSFCGPKMFVLSSSTRTSPTVESSLPVRRSLQSSILYLGDEDSHGWDGGSVSVALATRRSSDKWPSNIPDSGVGPWRTSRQAP
jgi:hypothetical protein